MQHTLEMFISSIENSARINRWEEADKVEITLTKLAGSAKTFYKECSELHADGLTWPEFKTVLGIGTKTSTRTSTILSCFKQLDKLKVKILSRLPTDAGS